VTGLRWSTLDTAELSCSDTDSNRSTSEALQRPNYRRVWDRGARCQVGTSFVLLQKLPALCGAYPTPYPAATRKSDKVQDSRLKTRGTTPPFSPTLLIAWRLIRYTETSCFYRNSSPDSSVVTVIILRAGRLGNRLSVFGRGKRFISSLDRLCVPRSLFYKKYRVPFLRGRSGRELMANDYHWTLRLIHEQTFTYGVARSLMIWTSHLTQSWDA